MKILPIIHKATKPLLVAFILLGLLIYGNTIVKDSTISTVRAFGDLSVQFGIPAEEPLFNNDNLAPGDVVTKTVQVSNNGIVPHFISTKAMRTTTAEVIESVLYVSILEDGNVLYEGTLEDFFEQSEGENGVPLSILDPSANTTYTLYVSFPETAGNEFQNNVITFDLVFGTLTATNNLMINEVYYNVAPNKGHDSPKDRGIDGIGGNNISIIINDNGAGSVNTVNVSLRDICTITQGNNMNVTNTVNQSGNTGGNTLINNTGSTAIQTGFISQFFSLFTFGGINVASCSKKLDQNHEWIELYNPTDKRISLIGWSLSDNSGKSVTFKQKRIDPGSFAIISKDSSTWSFWDVPKTAVKIHLGVQIGDGLDNEGDHLILRDSEGNIVDFVSWGDDTAIWDPAVSSVIIGESLERISTGFDTDLASDWMGRYPPTPGY